QLQNLPSDKKVALKESDFAPLLKYGLVRERFSALLTDALRGEWLEAQGYSVQLMEFIDIEHTPKNILIRAVKKCGEKESKLPKIVKTLGVRPEIWENAK
nr:SAM-dependent methyltransferase [Treponema sp.]